MSTFDGLICEIEGVSVDCFEKENLNSRVFFLSHCHTDHYRGINSKDFISYVERNKFFIYTSDISCIIIINRFPDLKKYVRPLTVGETHTIHVPKASTHKEVLIDVTLIPAGHCPGSVMFLFSTHTNQTILYTGDYRMNYEDLYKIKHLRGDTGPIVIDKLYFDSTFWDQKYSYFPSREVSCNVVCDITHEWLSRHSKNTVNLVIPASIGSEYLYLDIYNKMKMSICVNDNDLVLSYRQIAELENIFTLDNNARIFTSMRDSSSPRVRNIKVSALRWAWLRENEDIYKKLNDQKYIVCYSSHSNFEELKGLLQYLKPKALEPCVVTNAPLLYKSLNEFCKFFLHKPVGDFNCNKHETVDVQKQGIKNITCSFYSSDSDEEILGKVPKMST